MKLERMRYLAIAFVVSCDLVAMEIVQWKFVPFVVIPVVVVSAVYLLVLTLATRYGDILFYLHQTMGLAAFLALIHLVRNMNMGFSIVVLVFFFAYLARLFSLRKRGEYDVAGKD